MIPSAAQVALNPLQWFATPDGWLDWSLSPALPDLYSEVRRAGFDAVATKMPAGMSVAEYHGIAQDAGLDLAPGTAAIAVGDGDVDVAQTIDALRPTLRAYAALGLDRIFVLAAMDPAAPRVARPAVGADFDAARLDRIAALLTALGEAAVAEGVLPILHPHVGGWVETESETRAVLEAVPAGLLGFGPDVGHLSWAGADVPALLGDYRDRVRGIHLKDLKRSVATASIAAGDSYQQTVAAGLWTEPGTGDLDYDAMWAALGADWSGPLIVEVDRGAVEPPFESARLSAEWMRAQRS